MMKKSIIYITAIFAGAFMTGCEHSEDIGTKDVGILQTMDYAFPFSGGNAEPVNGATFTFVSYHAHEDGTTSLIPDSDKDQQPIGRYAWLSDGKYKNILQPCDLNNDYTYAGRNPQNGQALLNGDYMTVCLHPAVPVEGNGRGAHCVPFKRDDVVMASEPFGMSVKGYEVFSLPVKFSVTEIRSKILLEFEQGGDNEITIENVSLMNPGYYGWYHPLTGSTDISYNESNPKDIYDYENRDQLDNTFVSMDVSDNPGDYDPNSANDKSGAFDIYETGETGKGAIVYTTGKKNADGLFLFANDYESDYFPQIGLTFDFYSGSDPEVKQASIPLNINMKHGECYRFKLTFTSTEIKVSYSIRPWDGDGVDDDQTIGGNPPEIPFGSWSIKEWDSGEGGGEIGIGKPKP